MGTLALDGTAHSVDVTVNWLGEIANAGWRKLRPKLADGECAVPTVVRGLDTVVVGFDERESGATLLFVGDTTKVVADST
jgi:hypothetical protein